MMSEKNNHRRCMDADTVMNLRFKPKSRLRDCDLPPEIQGVSCKNSPLKEAAINLW